MAKKVMKKTITETTTDDPNKNNPLEETKSKKSKTKKAPRRRKASKKIEESLVKNLLQLQKVHVDLAEKFDKLSSEISSLLSLFEMAARSFAKSPSISQTQKDTEFLEKIDRLLEQNKTIAKGLTLMEDKVRERIYPIPPSNYQPQAIPINYQQQKPPQSQEFVGQPPDPNAPATQDIQQITPSKRPLPKF